MKKQKTALLLLTAALLTAALGSCGDAADADTKTTDSADTVAVTVAETEEPDMFEQRKLVSDDLGEADFDGYEFRVVTSDFRAEYVVMESETGDVIDDAVYNRNAAVEDRFNCKIVSVMDDDYSKGAAYITKAVLAGEDAFDLTSFHVVALGQITPNGYFMNWYNIPHINFEKPWWSSSTVENLTFDGKCYIAIGDFAISALSAAYCVFYNKTLGQNYDMPDMFEVVTSGKFTFDYLTSLTKDLYQDLNQNGTVDDEDDLFGFTSDASSNLNAYLWAFDNPIFTNTDNGLVFTYKTEKIADIVTKLSSTFNQYDGIRANRSHINAQGSAHDYGRDIFAKGRSVFANGYIGMSLTHFRELEDDFSILPYPKWDEAQTEYRTMSDGNHGALAVPVTIADPDKVGTIIEALCAESYKILVPAYYDVALKVKSTRDEQSIEMIDMIVNARMFDFGYVYDAWFGCSFFLEQLVGANNTNFESFWAKKEYAVMKYYDKVLNFFKENDN